MYISGTKNVNQSYMNTLATNYPNNYASTTQSSGNTYVLQNLNGNLCALFNNKMIMKLDSLGNLTVRSINYANEIIP